MDNKDTKIVLHYRTKYSYKIFYENGSDIGEIEKLEDGNFVWFPRFDCGGAFTEQILFDIAKNLRQLNRDKING